MRVPGSTARRRPSHRVHSASGHAGHRAQARVWPQYPRAAAGGAAADRKSTRLNSSHSQISYAVFCLKKKKKKKKDAADRLNIVRGYILVYYAVRMSDESFH